MKRISIGLFCMLISLGYSSFAQYKSLKSANEEFEKLSYPQAVRAYESFLRAPKNDLPQRKEALQKLAFSYRKLQDSKNAERVYNDLISAYGNDLESEQYLYYAQALANNGKYRESQKYYSIYGEMQKADLRGNKYAAIYMDKSVFYQDSSLFKIQYLYPINSKYSDFSPMFYNNKLVFVSARKEGSAIKRIFNQNETPFLDLFMFTDTSALTMETRKLSALEQASLGSSGQINDIKEERRKLKSGNDDEAKVVEFSKQLNSKYHEGPVSFFSDKNRLVFTRNNYLNGKARKNDKGINLLKLYMAEKKRDKWLNIKALPFTTDEYSTGHPAISADDKRLYFVSDMPGGFGGTDLYVVDYIDGNWGTPLNLGREINTEGNEMFPYIDENNNLYFSSDGHPGLGGLDVFNIEFRNGLPYGEAKNLGAPINSNRDDFGLIANADMTKGYFSSNRKRGFSDDNIYSFEKGCKDFKIGVYDAATKLPIDDADVRLLKNGRNRKLYITDKNGKSDFCIESGTDVELKVAKEGYEMQSVTYGTMSTSLSKGQNVNVYLEKTKKVMVKGKVVSEIDNKPIAGATVTLENQLDGSIETVVTGPDGKYTFQPEKLGKYVVKAVKENYALSTDNIVSLTKNKNNSPKSAMVKDFGMVAVGDVYKIDNIYYKYGKYDIDEAGQKIINNELLKILRQNPMIKVEIGSHTDSQSSDDFNMELSEKRAQAVVAYLLKKGVAASRLAAKGYGETQLVNGCTNEVKCTDAEHKMNRRTVFKILDVQTN